MSAPDTPTPKSAPSLLGDAPAPAAGKAAAAPANGSRILANLEGRVVPPAAPPRAKGRSHKAAALAALCLIAAGGFGAWHGFGRGAGGTQLAAGGATARSAAVASASVPAAPAAVSAPPQTATIVAGDDADDADDARKPGAAALAPADDSRLSRALADGAKDANASAAESAGASPSASASAGHNHADAKAEPRRQTKSEAKNDKGEAKKAHRASNATAVAQAKQHDTHRAGTKDDPDADLLAVLVARTKPSEGKPGPRPVKAAAASASLAQQVKACGQRGFFEEQLCRWRVCDGHWGTDAACPAAARASTEH